MGDTVLVFIHGLAKKPKREDLLEAWEWALTQNNPRPEIFGNNNPPLLPMSKTDTRLVYYADVMYGDDFQTDYSSYRDLDEDLDTESEMTGGGESSNESMAEAARPEAHFEKLLFKRLGVAVEPDSTDEAFGLIPKAVRKLIIKKFAKEAYYYLFNEMLERDGQQIDYRGELRSRLLTVLKEEAAAGKKIIVAAHSLGSILIYDTLRNHPECPPIDRLITFGSPLGVSEVQDELVADGQDTVDFPPKLRGEWFNVSDPLDPICALSPRLRKEYLKEGGVAVIDVKQSNWGKWRHSVTKYLCGNGLRLAMQGRTASAVVSKAPLKTISKASNNELHARFIESIVSKAGGAEAVIARISNASESAAANKRGKRSTIASSHTRAMVSAKAATETLESIGSGSFNLADHGVIAEAIVDVAGSPVLYVKNGSYAPTDHADWDELNQPVYRARVEAVLPSVGRIELPGQTQIPYAGTGFMIGPNLMMTNRHVAQIFASGLGLKGLRFKTGFRAATNFTREKDQTNSSPDFRIRKVVMIHPYWDIALLQVDGDFGDRKPLKLSLQDGREMLQHDVFVVGYPAEDGRNPYDVQNRLFSSFRTKRLQPGRLLGPASTASFGKSVNAVGHSCSTLGGNSGSAVFSLETGDVLGVHFGGLYKTANFAVPSIELSRDQRVIDAGVRFEGIPKIEKPVKWQSWWDGSESVEDSDDDTAAASATAATTNAPIVQTAMLPAIKGSSMGNSVTLEIPLRITIKVEVPGLSAPVTETVAFDSSGVGLNDGTSTTEALIEPAHESSPASYRKRKGYNENFLEAVDKSGKALFVPLPVAKRPSVLARTFDGEKILNYQNFSVAMHAKRRVCLFAASNVTANPTLKNPDPSQSTTRAALSGLGKNDMEKWFLDPRLDAKFQLPDVFYTKDRQSFDKGHMVRREDVAWGRNYDDLKRANGDSYHVTNCSPQVKDFNRSGSGELNWGDLENAVLAQAKSERLCVFAGPICKDDDETFRGAGDNGEVIVVKIPRRFWKVIVSVGDQGLTAYGIVLEQDLSAADTEATAPDQFLPFLWRINDIGMEAGVRFPAVISKADQYESGNFETLLASGVRVKGG